MKPKRRFSSCALLAGILISGHAFAQTGGAPAGDQATAKGQPATDSSPNGGSQGTTAAGGAGAPTSPTSPGGTGAPPHADTDIYTPSPVPAAPKPLAPSGRSTEDQTTSATATPMSGFRGGTLGFPGTGATGIVAALKLPILTGETTKLETIAQIGQLDLGNGFAVDVIGEHVTLDVPSTTFSPGQGQPLPKLATTDLTSAGLRLRWGSRTPTNELYRALSRCLGEMAASPQGVADAAEAAACKNDFDVPAFRNRAPSDAEVAEAKSEFEDRVNQGPSISVGLRGLYRSEQIGGNAPGIAGEVTPQLGFSTCQLFVSESVLWISDSKTDENNVVSKTSTVTESRSTAGFVYRVKRKDLAVAPRFGLYGTYTRNFWKNEFAVSGTDPNIRGNDLEGGLFVSGRFSGGFNGMVQIGVHRPFGAESKPEFFFNIIPSIGSSVGGGS
jgi:hypothetical protein